MVTMHNKILIVCSITLLFTQPFLFPMNNNPAASLLHVDSFVVAKSDKQDTSNVLNVDDVLNQNADGQYEPGYYDIEDKKQDFATCIPFTYYNIIRADFIATADQGEGTLPKSNIGSVGHRFVHRGMLFWIQKDLDEHILQKIVEYFGLTIYKTNQEGYWPKNGCFIEVKCIAYHAYLDRVQKKMLECAHENPQLRINCDVINRLCDNIEKDRVNTSLTSGYGKKNLRRLAALMLNCGAIFYMNQLMDENKKLKLKLKNIQFLPEVVSTISSPLDWNTVNVLEKERDDRDPEEIVQWPVMSARACKNIRQIENDQFDCAKIVALKSMLFNKLLHDIHNFEDEKSKAEISCLRVSLEELAKRIDDLECLLKKELSHVSQYDVQVKQYVNNRKDIYAENRRLKKDLFELKNAFKDVLAHAYYVKSFESSSLCIPLVMLEQVVSKLDDVRTQCKTLLPPEISKQCIDMLIQITNFCSIATREIKLQQERYSEKHNRSFTKEEFNKTIHSLQTILSQNISAEEHAQQTALEKQKKDYDVAVQAEFSKVMQEKLLLAEQNVKLEKEKADLVEIIQEIETDHQKEIEKLKQEHDAKQQASTMQIKTLEDQIKKDEEEIKKLQNQTSTQDTLLEKKDLMVTQLRDEIVDLKNELENAKTALQGEAQKSSEFAEQNGKLEKEKAGLVKKIQEIEIGHSNQIEKLKQEHDAEQQASTMQIKTLKDQIEKDTIARAKEVKELQDQATSTQQKLCEEKDLMIKQLGDEIVDLNNKVQITNNKEELENAKAALKTEAQKSSEFAEQNVKLKKEKAELVEIIQTSKTDHQKEIEKLNLAHDAQQQASTMQIKTLKDQIEKDTIARAKEVKELQDQATSTQDTLLEKKNLMIKQLGDEIADLNNKVQITNNKEELENAKAALKTEAQKSSEFAEQNVKLKKEKAELEETIQTRKTDYQKEIEKLNLERDAEQQASTMQIKTLEDQIKKDTIAEDKATSTQQKRCEEGKNKEWSRPKKIVVGLGTLIGLWIVVHFAAVYGNTISYYEAAFLSTLF